MSRQRDLFDVTHRVRAHDPATSVEAAEKTRESSAVQRQACLAYVRAHPGQTAAEVSRGCGLERHVASRRLPELRDAGLVVNGPARVCRVQGTKAMTWHATETT